MKEKISITDRTKNHPHTRYLEKRKKLKIKIQNRYIMSTCFNEFTPENPPITVDWSPTVILSSVDWSVAPEVSTVNLVSFKS